ncbi:MAG: hypothetical protein UR68_C0045G0008 [Candidatus Roizmanbacteria bacterium GW2011_GWA2_35_19]|uniref:Uncharacterized protein n=1 Tax=Candidatus Roizmanbacteria bacterium GW2011_GWA2_35_19 TaxID=1618478 RepID=A0A0G0BKU6_9BACT|nr:MAG: hypothetical protein UR68_C0045G0008 [Candidatus Roizmanbacteria bacterium GW2011_GWA2_35_19]
MNGLAPPEQNPKEIMKKTYPHVAFQLNQEVDTYVGADFLEARQNGIDFNKHPLLIPALKVQGEERKNIVNNYVQEYYDHNRVELETAKKTFQDEWGEVEPAFFNITNTVFNEYEWPSGEYRGFPSIFNCNPRWLETKSFQVYVNNVVGVSYSVAHEMLHFIFYNYLEKKYPDYVKQIGEDKLWSLSEVFNEIAFEQPEYSKFKPNVPSSYPKLQPMTTALKEKLKGKQFNIESFIEASKSI